MEIGGIDVLIENSHPLKVAEDIVLSSVRAFWPDLVVEIDDSLGHEIFVYQNQAAKDSWDIDVTDENIDTMIYVIFQNGSTTVVHDGNEEIVETIRRSLACS